MKYIKITCPRCAETANLQITEDQLNENDRGLITVNITKGFMCSDSFTVYIDRNLNVRDYFFVDFRYNIPEITLENTGEVKEKKLLEKIDLIKLYMPALQLSFILNSIFSKQKIVLILNEEFLYEYIYDFLNYITRDSFEINIQLIPEDKYRNNKKKFKDAMVFQGIKIVKNFKKKINPQKLFIEKHIASKFIMETENEFPYIYLRNEVLKSYKLALKISNFINDFQKNREEVNILKIGSQLEKLYSIKINNHYLSFLLDVVKSYFQVEVPRLGDSFLYSL